MLPKLSLTTTLLLLLISVCRKTVHAFSIGATTTSNNNRKLLLLLLPRRSSLGAKDSNNDNDDDWRAFRAKLVQGEADATRPTNTNYNTNTDDWDGIGALFDDGNDSDTNSNVDIVDDSMINTNNNPSSSSSSYAYESILEQGSVVLGGVDQDYGFGLRQQYFHKAVILLTQHTTKANSIHNNGDNNNAVGSFTKGLILNRPTDFGWTDPRSGLRWKIWFGGDVQGFDDMDTDLRDCNNDDKDDASLSSLLLWNANPNAEFTCLHSLDADDNPAIAAVSTTILGSAVQSVRWSDAVQLVANGHAVVDDFWLFCGYAGWGPGQLQNELDDHKSWYMVSTDPETVWLPHHQKQQSQPQNAGLETWQALMHKIGRPTVDVTGTFDDHMLKEWVRHHLVLLTSDDDDDANESDNLLDELRSRITSFQTKDNNDNTAAASTTTTFFQPGDLVRASDAARSPFLLEQQQLHKSVVLILSDDELCTIGLVLNRPATQGLEIRVLNNNDNTTIRNSVVQLPIRFGGQYLVQTTDQQDESSTSSSSSSSSTTKLLWLHRSKVLQMAQIGATLGNSSSNNNNNNIKSTSNICRCTADDVTAAVQAGLAQPTEFLAVSGVSLWPKSKSNTTTRKHQDHQSTREAFVHVPAAYHDRVWAKLLEQPVLDEDNLDASLETSMEVWRLACHDNHDDDNHDDNDKTTTADPVVYQTNVAVSDLSDQALRSWIATFLFGDPTL